MTSKGGRRGVRRMDKSGMSAAVMDRRYWVGLGIVYLPDGEAAHYELDEDVGILVNVRLMPNEEPLLCRLGGFGEGGSQGVWRIPPVGSEVAVAVPGGAIDGETIIVGVLASGGTPAELDADTLVVRAPKVVIIAEGAVEIGQSGLTITDGVVHGSGIDPFTGATYAALSNTSATLRAKK